MRAYKCDRCGKLFEKYDGQGTRRFYSITTDLCSSNNGLDLCTNCNAELQAWVANDKEQVACNSFARSLDPEWQEAHAKMGFYSPMYELEKTLGEVMEDE